MLRAKAINQFMNISLMENAMCHTPMRGACALGLVNHVLSAARMGV